ncbi:hypothetical protein BG011_000477 [Mortierella polycephala]|uniref:B30.2/SPRY domain-containing protein n=1 Tax=Mortierella polycephala TaxID=41804 RepID=A0A9P6QGU0_9FUNG|nr:hypothetical protein BG011_000477 [Mortierella polycephala]
MYPQPGQHHHQHHQHRPQHHPQPHPHPQPQPHPYAPQPHQHQPHVWQGYAPAVSMSSNAYSAMPPSYQQQQSHQYPYYQQQSVVPSTSPELARPTSSGYPTPFQAPNVSSGYYPYQHQQSSATSTPVALTRPLSGAAAYGGLGSPTPLPASGGSSPVVPALLPGGPTFYKAEMTESQVQTWQQQQQQQQAIKVEVPSSHYTAQQQPPTPTSTPTPLLQQTQVPALDVHAEIQLQLQRQSQLQAMQMHGRHSNGSTGTVAGVPHSPQPSWTQPQPLATANMGIRPSSPFPPSPRLPMHPTPVEHQSSLTDITPISYNSQESSLTTLDSAPIAAVGVHAGVSRPYASSMGHYQDQQAYPSSIENQSSLTEIDATTGSGPRSNASGTSGFQSHIQNQYMSHGQQHSYVSAIEQQSSLTELDNLPFPLEAQSSLTEVDSLPHALEEQSALTVVDDLPYALEEQSALTVVDDLPYSLEEQSALTEIDNLPHALPEQSSLTVLDEPTAMCEGSKGKDIQDRVQPRANTASPASPLKVVAVTTTSTASIASSASSASTTTTTTTETESTTVMSHTVSLTPESATDAPASLFSMSNWSLPSNFSDPTDVASNPVADIAKSGQEDRDVSVRDSLHKRPPASMHIDTTLTHTEEEAGAPMEEPASAGILIPLSPTSAVDSPKPNVSIAQSLSASSPLSRMATNSTGSTPPIPAPKPASLLAAKTNRPQSGASGASLDSLLTQEILTLTPTFDGVTNELSLVDEELEEVVTEDDEQDDIVKVDDGMSAFIRELQSSMTLSRSESGSSSHAGSSEDRGTDHVKRTDSNSSRIGQRGNDTLVETPSGNDGDLERLHSASACDQDENPQVQELQHLETIQFEWSFSDSEQVTYERIFSLWERPAEECVSSDIAGKVFMTLGLMNHDLYKICQLLNPEEKPVLNRTEFIAGLHLVNCKAIGYELPEELPDELMMSAAAIGRIVIPPRPVQGPSAVLPKAVESTATIMQSASESHVPRLIPVQAAVSKPSYPAGSNFMHTYDASLSSYSSAVPLLEADSVEPTLADSDVYLAYPYPASQQQSPPSQHMPQYQNISPGAMQHTQQYYTSGEQGYSMSIAPVVFQPQATSPQSPSAAPVLPSKPGPHALHNLPENAPVIVSFEDEPIDRSDNVSPVETEKQLPPQVQEVASTDSASDAIVASSTSAQRQDLEEDPDLYLSSPDAWDDDSTPPEMDVEGSYTKYRSDFKNDMTVSASVTANHPINPKCGVYYFEVFIERFKGNSAISVGIASKSLRKNCQVGWDLNSWGYHSDDGFLYFGNGKQNIEYSYEYGEGDTIGCGINFLDRAVFFTLNGDMSGVAFKFIKDSIPLYPAIGLSQAGTEINANFGDQTFLFNIIDYKKRVMSKPIHPQMFLTWNNGARNEKVFQILADGLSVIASGKDAGCIRGPKVSPRDKNVFYFEVTILYMPATVQGTISVGICGKDQEMTDIMGWKPNSYGYSGECGDFLSISLNRSSLYARSLSGKMKARARGPSFRSGSVVGCGVDFASRELFFTLNGECLGQAFYELDVLDCYPCVSVIDGGGGVGGPLSHLREQTGTSHGSHGHDDGWASERFSSQNRGGFEFKANFGQFPFMFDLAAFEASGGHY